MNLTSYTHAASDVLYGIRPVEEGHEVLVSVVFEGQEAQPERGYCRHLGTEVGALDDVLTMVQ